MLIRDLVQQILSTGYLSVSIEDQLRYLLAHTQYDREDFNAFISLQMAMINGQVQQQSWDLLCHSANLF